MFINSELPLFRKARGLAVEISSFEATFLQHTSYVDTTKLITLSEEVLSAALMDAARATGTLLKKVQDRIVVAVEAHNVMVEEQRQAVIS
jgi:hypothetical protein